MIRTAIPEDLTRLTDIYNQAILTKKATADIEPFSPEQRKSWFKTHMNNTRTPIFVYEVDGIVAGYCYLSEYRGGRAAVQSMAEISYYIDSGFHRRGIGSMLIHHTIDAARDLGYKKLFAVMLSCNDGSLALLKKNGFELWGTFPDVVYIDDHIYSNYYFGLKLED